jgi:hypothetical protein
MEEKVYKRIAFNGQVVTYTISEELNKIDEQKQCPEKLARANAVLEKNREQVLQIIKEHAKK